MYCEVVVLAAATLCFSLRCLVKELPWAHFCGLMLAQEGRMEEAFETLHDAARRGCVGATCDAMEILVDSGQLDEQRSFGREVGRMGN